MHKLPLPLSNRYQTPLTNHARSFALFLLVMVCGCPSTEVTSGCVARNVDGQCIDWGFSLHLRPKADVTPPTEGERSACLRAIRQATSQGLDLAIVRELECSKFIFLLPSPRPIPRPPPPPPEPEPGPEPTPDPPDSP